MTADPSQGSDVERVQRAQAVYDMAANQPQQVINYREAQIHLLEVMNTPDIETLAPEPDPNAQDPEQQLMIASMQMEAELKQKDQELRQKGQDLQEMKLAMEAAKTMSELGLKADEQEAKITELYSRAAKNIVDAGIANGEAAFGVVDDIENTYIDGGQKQRYKYNPDTGALDNA